MLLPTTKETPSEAEVISHQLLLRGGFIRKLTSGVYTYLPLGLAAIQKVAQIVREEMNNSGAQELLMPMVQPADLGDGAHPAEIGRRDLTRHGSVVAA